jgi:O-antigen/teichoic acid export membrane protein
MTDSARRVPRAAWLGIVWSNAAFVVTRAVGFLGLVVLTRLLAPRDFGLVAAVLVILGVLELGSDLGMRASVIYEQQEGITKRVQTAFTFGLLIAVVVAGIGYALAPLLDDAFGIHGVTGLFRLALINILLTSLGNVHDALLLREMALKRRTVSEVVRGVVRAIVGIALALAGSGAASLVWGMLAGTAAWAATLWWLTRFVPSLSFDRRIARSMASYGLGASALDALAAITTRIDAVAIARFLGSRSLGLYTVAFRVPETLIQSVAWNVSEVVFPALSRQRVLDREGLPSVTTALIRFQALYALPAAAALAGLSRPLVAVLFGPRWEKAAGVLAAVAVMTGIAALIHPVGDLLKAVGRQRILVAANLILIPIILVAVAAASSSGIVAVAWARAGSVAFFAVLLTVLTPRSLGLRLTGVLRAALPGLAAAAGMACGVGAVRILWPALSAGPLLAGAMAGTAASAVALRLLAPETFGILRAQLAHLAKRRRPPSAPRHSPASRS